jgi:transcriptional regulator with XRE-family HTH domain
LNTTITDINGSVFEEKRLELEISREDLAKSLCLNANQIRQIETGGQVSFYSFAQKVRSAKKVAEYLQIPEELAFTYKTMEVSPTPATEISLKEVLNAEPELKSTQVTKSKNKLTAPLLVGALLLTTSLSFWIYSGDGKNSTLVAKENDGDKIFVSIPEKERLPSAPNQE